MMKREVWWMAWSMVALASAPVAGQTRFEVAVSGMLPEHIVEEARTHGLSGRLVVLLIKDGANLRGETRPVDGPFWEDPQPLYGVDVAGYRLGPDSKPMVVDDLATGFPAALSQLPPGGYRAQARLDRVRQNSNWAREEGNLFSSVVRFVVEKGKDGGPTGSRTVTLVLDDVIEPKPLPEVAGVEWVEVESKLLSAFRGERTVLRAGVVLPKGFDAKKAGGRRYPAVYSVPGFGGDHRDAAGRKYRMERAADEGTRALHENAFWISLDPEGPNGHTLFADSANNGPCGRALIEELIPALEEQFPIVSQAEARIVTGHSSGGWSSLWLATAYPEVFGGCFSSAPDPVDFRRFQLVDIYADSNAYEGETHPSHADGASVARSARLAGVIGAWLPPKGADGARDLASYRRGEKPVMSIRQEFGGEHVVGPGQTSGMQWHSWMAVFGPRVEGADGAWAASHPAALFDPATGAIDAGVADRLRAYDTSDRLAKDPARYLPILRERVRLIVGDQDNFFLNEAVALLKARVEELSKALPAQEGGAGYIKIIPGKDHGTVLQTDEYRAFTGEMVEHFRKHGLIPEKPAEAKK